MSMGCETRPRLLIAGGATGGHLYPGVAVAQCWLRQAGGEVLFAGVRHRLEERVLAGLGFRLAWVHAGGLNGVGLRRALPALARLPLGLAQGLRIVSGFRPHVVLSLGGFAAGPVALAALLAGCPLVLLEVNALPGLTHRLLARCTGHVAVAWASTAACFPAARVTCTGTPVRQDLVQALQQRSPWPPGPRPALQGDPCRGRLHLLVLGGSQGAKEINALLAATAPLLAPRRAGLAIRHISGHRDQEALGRAYERAGLEARVRPFADDMAGLYAWAHLAISQAGASTCAELALAGLPVLFVPFSRAAEDHQARNAAAMVQGGAGWMWRAEELTPEILARFVLQAIDDPDLLISCCREARSLARPGAAEAVVRVLREAM